MKTIDEIEKLSLEDLERISLDNSIEVPDGLENRIGQALYARSRKRMIPWICGIAASLLLVVGLAISLRPPQLQDTFDDVGNINLECACATVDECEVQVNLT